MRSDYALYTVAVIFFIVTSILMAYQVELRELWTITTVVLGLLFIGLGYSQRPKPKATTIQAAQVATTPTPVTKEKTETAVKTATPSVALTEVKGIGEKRSEQLKTLHISSIEDLAKASAKDLAAKLKISPKITRRWVRTAKKLIDKS